MDTNKWNYEIVVVENGMSLENGEDKIEAVLERNNIDNIGRCFIIFWKEWKYHYFDKNTGVLEEGIRQDEIKYIWRSGNWRIDWVKELFESE